MVVRNVVETICPIWVRCDDGFDLIGSSVLCAIGDETFLISAAHVLDFAKETELFVGTKTGYLALTETATLTRAPDGSRANDHIDIGYMRLSTDTLAHLFPAYGRLPVSWICVDNESTAGRKYRVSGCPWRKVLKSGRTISPRLFSLNLRSYPNTKYQKLNVDSRTHIVLEFQPRRMANEAKQKITAPNLEGVSGGPVWQLEEVVVNGQPATQLKLAGIAIEHRKPSQALIATRIIAPLEGIRSRHPELSQFIPRNPHIDVLCRHHN